MTKITQDNAHSTLCIVHESCDGTQTDCRAANGMRPGFAAVEAEGEADGEEAVAEAVRDADYAARGGSVLQAKGPALRGLLPSGRDYIRSLLVPTRAASRGA